MPANMSLDRPTRPATPLTAQELQNVLDHISQGWSLTSAARYIGRTRQAIYEHIERSQEFANLYTQAKHEGVNTVEDVVRECAMDPKHFLDRIAWLKAHARSKWGDQPQSSGSQAPTINITIVAPSPSELRDIVAGEYRMLPDPSEAPHKEAAHDADSST